MPREAMSFFSKKTAPQHAAGQKKNTVSPNKLKYAVEDLPSLLHRIDLDNIYSARNTEIPVQADAILCNGFHGKQFPVQIVYGNRFCFT